MKSPQAHVSSVVLLTMALCASQQIGAAETTPAIKPDAKSQANQAIQPQVDKRAAQEAERKRTQLMAEAQSAIAETERALNALNQAKPKDALDALALATGKLELILARNPKLALAPVRTDVVVHDLLAKTDSVKASVKEARALLNDGEVQKPRALMDALGLGWFDKIKPQIADWT